MKKTIIAALLFGLALAMPAPVVAAPPQPALWHIQGPHGDVTLFGSIHLLPPGIAWQTPAIRAAIARADVFVFETPSDGAAQARIRTLIARHGLLPPGQSLRALLPAAAQTQYDAALASSHLSPALADRERPWLVDLQLLVAQAQTQNYSRSAGVEQVILAAAGQRPLRYLETTDQQFALLAPKDGRLELQMFESDLTDLRKQAGELARLVRAWRDGDVAAIDRLMNSDLAAYPAAKKALLTDRNQKWVPQIEAMLRGDKHVFVTVGAGHLAGPDGVPALLRKAGYRVDGP